MTLKTEAVDQGSTRQTTADRAADAIAESDDRSSSETETQLPLDVVFELLSNERRRRVMRYLLAETEAETQTQTTLGDLAEHIASIENDKPENALSSSERKRVYIVLYQCHLPKLDDAGVIDFDQNRKTVTPASGLNHFRSYLAEKGATEPTESAAKYYLGLSLLGAGALAVQTIIFPAIWLTGIILGALFTVVCLAAVDYLRQFERLS